ncbi:hypothetical protein EG329_014049 [Mollisiaceae sp. DMI_Dod_QoI]|nr:hypothetical protein EG329_014049 [Helotiales sp. DMI_Dod_QoI]
MRKSLRNPTSTQMPIFDKLKHKLSLSHNKNPIQQDEEYILLRARLPEIAHERFKAENESSVVQLLLDIIKTQEQEVIALKRPNEQETPKRQDKLEVSQDSRLGIVPQSLVEGTDPHKTELEQRDPSLDKEWQTHDHILSDQQERYSKQRDALASNIWRLEQSLAGLRESTGSEIETLSKQATDYKTEARQLRDQLSREIRNLSQAEQQLRQLLEASTENDKKIRLLETKLEDCTIVERNLQRSSKHLKDLLNQAEEQMNIFKGKAQEEKKMRVQAENLAEKRSGQLDEEKLVIRNFLEKQKIWLQDKQLVQELQAKLKKEEQASRDLEEEMKSHQQTDLLVEWMSSQLKEEEGVIRNLQQESEETRLTLERAQDVQMKMETQLDLKDLKVHQLEEEVQTQCRAMKEAKSELSRSKIESDDLKFKVSQHLKNIDELTENLHHTVDVTRELQLELQIGYEAYQSLESKTNMFEYELDQRALEINGLQAELQEKREGGIKEQEETDRLREKLRIAERLAEDLTADLQKERESHSRTKIDQGMVEDQLRRNLSETNTDKAQMVQQWKHTLARVNESKDQLQEHVDQMKVGIQELEEAIQSRDRIIGDTRLEMNKVKTERDQEKRKVDEASEQSKVINQQWEFVQQECARMVEENLLLKGKA